MTTCPVLPTLTLSTVGEECHVSACMNNINGFCCRTVLLQLEGDVQGVAKVKCTTTQTVEKAVDDARIAIVANSFFEHLLGKSVLEATDADFSTVGKSAQSFQEWNTTPHTFPQITRILSIIHERL